MLIDLLLLILLAIAVIWGLCFLLMPLHLAKLWQEHKALTQLDTQLDEEQDEREPPVVAPRPTQPARADRKAGKKPLYLQRPRDPRSLPLP